MNVYNQLMLSKFNENILNQLTAAAAFRNSTAQPAIDSDSSANDIDAIAEKSETATMPEASADNFEQMNQHNNENHLTNNILHEINRQFLSALLHKGEPKSTTGHNKQNVNLNPLTPPQTPITIAQTLQTTSKATNASFGGGVSRGNSHASNATLASQSMAANSSEFNENCPTISATDISSHRKRKRPTVNRSNKRQRNVDVSSTDDTDPDADNDTDGDDRFVRSDISSDTEHDDKSNCSDGHDSSNLSKIGIGFGENETSFDSVSTIPAGNSLLFNSGSKAPVAGGGLNLVTDKDKLNLLKLISLQSDENKLIGEYECAMNFVEH